jgi:pimeloyl-ACP methyl ester carboxylesterase
MNTSSTATASVVAPSRLLQLLELRAPCELAASVAALPWLRLAPRGDGHPVLVLPGLIASDASTRLLRKFLARRGYDVYGWGLGRKVSLIGQSLGGAYARMLSAQRPDAVRSVITLGSPVRGHPRANNAWRIYAFTAGKGTFDARHRQQVAQTPPVPTTAIYSRSDGVVAWQNSVEPSGPHSESIEVVSSHVGMAVHPAVLYAAAERLAQPEGQWKPFERRGWRAAVFPRANSPK